MWILFLFFWLCAALVVYAYLQQQKQITSISDVMWTGILDAALGVFATYAIANLHLNLNNWVVIIGGFAGNLFFAYKLFEKRK